MRTGDRSKYLAIVFGVTFACFLINTERVDTRVVQVIYAIDPDEPLVREKMVLVGQLLDVFIDTRPAGAP